MIVDRIDCDLLSNDPSLMADRYRAMSYPLPDEILSSAIAETLPGKTAFLYSGSWRLSIDAEYIELKMFENCQLEFHPKTLFVEPTNDQFYHYVLSKLNLTNLLILHSDYWCGHRPLNEILDDLDRLGSYAKKIICTIPIIHTNFNKLTASVEDICASSRARIVGDSFLFSRP